MTLFDIPWILGDIRDKTEKIWEDMGEFGRLGLAWPRTLGRGFKPPKTMDNSIYAWFMSKIIPYYV